MTAAISACAVHMAFVRDGEGWTPWVVLAGGLAVTTFVGYERVASRSHFPTDVIAGALVGAGIGVLVPALHRSLPDHPLGVGPMYVEDGAGFAVTGAF